jgi:hypothetical protein
MADTITESQSTPPKASKDKKRRKNEVSRARRAAFAFATVGFSLGMMALFSLKAITNAAAMSALDGFKDVAIWIGAAYISGSAVDYSSAMIAGKFGPGAAQGRFGDGGGEGDADGRVSD